MSLQKLQLAIFGIVFVDLKYLDSGPAGHCSLKQTAATLDHQKMIIDYWCKFDYIFQQWPLSIYMLNKINSLAGAMPQDWEDVQWWQAV